MLLLAELAALVGGTVHTLVPGEEPFVGTVLVRDGTIEAIVPGEPELAPGTERYDVRGKHVVPGLIDALVAFDPAHDALYTAAGVTVVRDMGGSRVRSLIERTREARDRVPGPTLYTCGAVLDGDPPGSPDAAVLRDAHAVLTLLPILLDEKVDFLGVQLGLGEEAWRKVLEIGHASGLRVEGPVPRAIALEEALAAGQDGLHHLDRLVPEGGSWETLDLERLEPQIAAMARAQVALVPTLDATALRLVDQSRTPEPELLALLAPSYEGWWREELGARLAVLDEGARARGERVAQKQRALLARLAAAGVRLVPGSGAPHPWLFPGQALHRELARWVEAGVAPGRALELATRESARALGLEEHHGVLAPGRLADLVACEEDPRQGLESLAHPALVVVRGRVLERADLDDRLAALAARQKAAREALDVSLDFEPPEPAPGAPLLVGTVESRALGRRVAGERFALVRAADGALVLSGRVRYPGGETLDVVQTLRDGRLDALRVQATVGGKRVELEGLWTAERFRLRRSVDGVVLDTQSYREHPSCADLSSVTALVALGQGGAQPAASVLTFHELLAPELVRWEVRLEADGDYVVHTHNTAMAFRFDEHGAPLLFRTRVGQGLVETRLVASDAFGGGGLRPVGAPARAPGATVEAGARR